MTPQDAANANGSTTTSDAGAPRDSRKGPLRAAYARLLPPELVRETVDRLEQAFNDGLEADAEWICPDEVDLLGALGAVASDLEACAAALRDQQRWGAEGSEAPLTIQAYAAGLLANEAEDLARRARAVAAWTPSVAQPYPPTSGAGEDG